MAVVEVTEGTSLMAQMVSPCSMFAGISSAKEHHKAMPRGQKWGAFYSLPS